MRSRGRLSGLDLPRFADPRQDPMAVPLSQSANDTSATTRCGASPHCHSAKDAGVDNADRRSERKASPPSHSSQPPAHLLPPHACPEPGCHRRFKRKYTLEEHSKIHTGERPHVCPVLTCAKRFSTSGNLSRHKRLHGYIEPLQCPIQGCVCAFPSSRKLEKHMQFHYGGSVKVCLVVGCGKTFSTTGNLNRHLKHQHTDLEFRSKPVAMTSSPIDMSHFRSPTSSENWTPSALLPGPLQFQMPPMTLQIPPPPQIFLPPQHQQLIQQQQPMPLPLWYQEQQIPSTSAPVVTPIKSCADMFEEVWNPEILDTLVAVLHDPSAGRQGSFS